MRCNVTAIVEVVLGLFGNGTGSTKVEKDMADQESGDLVVEKLAESIWAFENSDNIESIEDQGAAFRSCRPEYLQKARLLMLKIQNRGGKVDFIK